MIDWETTKVKFRLSCIIALCLLLAGCRDRIPPTSQPTSPASLLDAHNAERSKAGLQPLQFNDKLTAAAQKHAAWMATHQTLSHNEGATTFSQRARNEGYLMSSGGENIAAGYKTVEAVMVGWMNSPGHRSNILYPTYKDIGYGVSGTYWCVVFGTQANHNALVVPEAHLPDGLWTK